MAAPDLVGERECSRLAARRSLRGVAPVYPTLHGESPGSALPAALLLPGRLGLRVRLADHDTIYLGRKDEPDADEDLPPLPDPDVEDDDGEEEAEEADEEEAD